MDLFCGCGGVTTGLKSARFDVIAAVDNDPIACRTFRANHSLIRLIEEDITSLDSSCVETIVSRHAVLDLMVVCAPCQPFSSHFRATADDDRTHLVLESVRFASLLRPKVILFENVSGMASPRFADLRLRLHGGLSDLGYELGSTVRLDAANFGVPQRRVRSIMVASKAGPPPVLPERSRNRADATVRAAIGDLRSLQSGESDPLDDLHFARRHRAIVIERLKHIPKNGGSRSSLPVSLQLACHRKCDGFPDVYGRMKWDAHAPTLTTGCTDLTRGRFAHPSDNRALTLREAARLQTFPDSYRFVGSASDIATQIGNAVPVRLMQELALSIRSQLEL